MALVEMVMPKMGESIMEGTILRWLKNVGDKIEQDESVLEVATDKVDTEVPATASGVLKEILAQNGEVIPVGKPIAIIATEGDDQSTAPAVQATPKETTSNLTTQTSVVKNETPAKSHISNGESLRFYSPLVMNIARQENVTMAELEAIKGTGKDERVTKNDILDYIQTRKTSTVASSEKQQFQEAHKNEQKKESAPLDQLKPAQSLSGNFEIIEMDRMRKMIADRMVESKRIAPHVTSFVEADVTNIVYWRNRVKQEFMEKENTALTFTPIFIEAVVKALKDYPMVNVSVDGDKIIVKKDINIGMAVALPSGNLIVPVIKNADQLNIIGLTKKVNDLAKRARANKLTPDDLSGGTYTVSNVGSFGNMMGTPIIMQPQAGILALGAVIKKPAVIETPQGDTLGIRHMMFLSHSYDHRVIDGSLGGMFVRRVADYLEQFDINRRAFA
ncbi:dihydrolipoamide acetyltransferase [Sporocytophaga myxococcoides]|uniref:Dihydrolipoamide acetyltransferase component of pyruvate dehydrogenase complex n=1 Tax=Sporocytophaga myxococcoides TaxID=153721 RepID=A0A098LJ92_9BACT|nr:dihydrolipoamide acetyltransferase family protein [Sporocytophaga myxococcoides]GAL86457.1 dihydrolipoamide acetyltransferase [Sporocytophaga myxococcoides]